VTQFLDALSPGLQEVLQTNPACSPPKLSTLTCGLSQLAALCALCIAAVCQFSLIRAQERLISKTVLCQTNRQSPSTAAVAAPFYAAAASCPASFTLTRPADDVSFQAHSFMSPVEQTMRRYQPAPSSASGACSSASGACPFDPVTNYQGTYPAGFQGCMFSGGADHVFRGCPQHETPGPSAVFYKNLFAQKPHLRKIAPQPN
jgi:hypothetical protein